MSSEEDILSKSLVSTSQHLPQSNMELIQESSTPSTGHQLPSSVSSGLHSHHSGHHTSYHHSSSHHQSLKINSGSNNNSSGCKVKRTRQRVDAGEPRNSYASISNFSSSRSSSFHSSCHSNPPSSSSTSSSSTYHHLSQKNGLTSNVKLSSTLHAPSDLLSSKSTPASSSNQIESSNTGTHESGIKSNYSAENMPPTFRGTNVSGSNSIFINGNRSVHRSLSVNGPCSPKSAKLTQSDHISNTSSSSSSTSSSSSSAHLLRGILQNGRKVINEHYLNLGKLISGSDQPNSPSDNTKGGDNSQCSNDLDRNEMNDDEDNARDDSEIEEYNFNLERPRSSTGISQERTLRSTPELSSSSLPDAFVTSASSSCSEPKPSSSSALSGFISEVKRARVENIVTNMLPRNSINSSVHQSGSEVAKSDSNHSPSSAASSSLTLPVNGCKKRKLYQPQQSKLNGPLEDEDEDVLEDDDLAFNKEDANMIVEEDNDDNDDNDEENESEITDLSKKDKKSDNELSSAQSYVGMQNFKSMLDADSATKLKNESLLNSSRTRSKVLTSSPVNLTTSESLDIADEDEETISEVAGTPVSQLSEVNNREAGGKIASRVTIEDDSANILGQVRKMVLESEKMNKDRRSQKYTTQPIQGHLLSDIEWLSETLKAEVQASLLPSLESIIDSVISLYCQRKAQSFKLANSLEPSVVGDSSKELNVLTQMLESKSPRAKLIEKVSNSQKLSSNQSNSLNGHPVLGSSYTLPAETASVPKPTGPSPFPFPPSFKSNIFFPNFPNNIGANQSQSTPGFLHPALAQHLSNFASVFQNREIGQPNLGISSSLNLNQASLNFTRDNQSASSNSSDKLPEPSPAEIMGEQTEALPLVVTPKRKRHKVTDSRITPRHVNRILSSQESMLANFMGRDISSASPPGPNVNFSLNHGPTAPPPPLVPVSLPTSVAIPNPSLHQPEIFSSPAFPFNDHARLLRESLFGQPQAGSEQENEAEHEKKNAAAAMAITNAYAANHLALLAQQQQATQGNGSPDSLHGYSGLQYSGRSENGAEGSETSLHDSPSMYENNTPLITLTPMHLRKAKLMFFYVRYPSSSVLKTFFPDIRFNKNNTAQLVKWFSNFREFYYIQMEKYARAAIGEGIKNGDDIRVELESELIRVLNLHYNRNNHIEVPEHFRYVVEQTLKEFFKAIYTGKDNEQSWKKAIYKIISRLDDSVPEYFKSSNFLEQLE